MKQLKVALVTGTGSGLGLELANRLVDRGWRVFGGIHHQRPIDPKFELVKINLSQDRSCAAAIKTISRQAGRIDLLINCAGLSAAGPTLDFRSQQFEELLQVNLVGPWRMIKYSQNLLVKSQGIIVNITSMNGLVALPDAGIYGATKAGLEALGLSLRGELQRQKVQVINIAPGFFIKTNQPKSTSWLGRFMPYTTVDQVANSVIAQLERKNLPPRMLVGNDVKLAYWLSRLMPIGWWDWLVSGWWSRRGSLALRK